METTQIMKPQNQIPLERAIRKERRIGRPQQITSEDVINAIKLYATTSETELSRRLNVSRQTIYPKMKEIPRETIIQIFRELSETELKPYQMTYEGFLTIPEVEQFKKALNVRQVSERYKNNILRLIWHLCVHLKRHPRKLTIEESAELLAQLKTCKIENLNLSTAKTAVRSWFENVHGINGEVLTSKGIDGSPCCNLGKRANDHLTQEQRYHFIETSRRIIRNGSLLDVWLSLPYFLYYTATRINAPLKARIENIEQHQDHWIITVVDKGRHKNGRKTWRKLIIGELKEKLEKNLVHRGNIKAGFLFPLEYQQVLGVFKTVYEKAGIPVPKQPCHVWRHTSAQDFLDATDWNYELCAQTLGWEDPRILRKCYGAMSETAKEKALKKAMGIPIEETRREFKF